MKYDIDDLILFAKASETLKLSVAAQSVHKSLPAASLRIKNLEEHFGVPLFVRRPKGLELTKAGQILKAETQKVLSAVESLEDKMYPFYGEASDVLSVLSNYCSLSSHLRAIVGKYLVKHPKTRIQFTLKPSNEILRAVAQGSTEIGFITYEYDYEGVQLLDFCDDAFVLALPIALVSEPMKKSKTIELHDLAKFPLVALSSDIPAQKFFERKAEARGIELDIRARFPTIVTGLEVASTLGAAMIVFESSLQKTFTTRKEEFKGFAINEDWVKIPQKICIGTEKGALSEPAKNFLNYVLEEAGTLTRL